jgi:HEAT repeat protein
MLDDAFDALKKYDWGTDRAPLAPIEAAVTAAHGKADAREDLEKRLLAALKSEISRDAKDFVCRMLTIVGGVASVPTLAGLLADDYHSHMARYVLERIPVPEAAQTLRDALPRLSGKLKIGVISSIGSRRDASAVPALSGLLNDQNASVARAAVTALGGIGNVEAAKALQESLPSAAETKQAVIDAQLACAEALLADNKSAVALAIYKSLAGDQQGRLVRLAATRGLLTCAARNA